MLFGYIENSIARFYDEISVNRLTGRTTAILNAAKAIDGIVFVHSHNFKDELRRHGFDGDIRVFNPGYYSEIKGINREKAIFIDHYLMEKNIKTLFQAFVESETNIQIIKDLLKAKNEELEIQYSTIQALNSEINEKDMIIEELENRIKHYPNQYMDVKL